MGHPERCTAKGCYGCSQFADVDGGGWRCVHCKEFYPPMTTLQTRLAGATEPTRELLEDARPAPPVCADFDEDCADIPDKVHCFLYDPAKGACPSCAILPSPV